MSEICCIQLTYKYLDDPIQTAQFTAFGSLNGFSTYSIQINGSTYYLWHDASDNWTISPNIGSFVDAVASIKNNVDNCPFPYSIPEWIADPSFSQFDTESGNCGFGDCCFAVSLIDEFGSYQFEANFGSANGSFNGAPYWQWNLGGIDCYELRRVFNDPDTGRCKWAIARTKCGSPPGNQQDLWTLDMNPCGCPIGQNWNDLENPDERIIQFFATANCGIPICIPMEDRHQRKYDSIKLPDTFEEPNRGFKICCECPMKVLAGGSETWENDITSAWIKLSSQSDAAAFVLKKNGIIASYIPAVNEFPNEENAFYATIPWADVLSSDGIGCYSLEIEYNISGIQGSIFWGQYDLLPYSTENALETARIRVKYNLRQEIEGINFTGANVEDCIRFHGFIGDRQPNMEIDNLIYQNRVVKTVVRENLDQYTITTDPLEECFILPLTDLFLLSENEMYISDYNAHNHSYRINDIPVIVEESPEIDYLDRFQRKAILSCVVGIRRKNRRTYY
jgi:hypothetical protein